MVNPEGVTHMLERGVSLQALLARFATYIPPDLQAYELQIDPELAAGLAEIEQRKKNLADTPPDHVDAKSMHLLTETADRHAAVLSTGSRLIKQLMAWEAPEEFRDLKAEVLKAVVVAVSSVLAFNPPPGFDGETERERIEADRRKLLFRSRSEHGVPEESAQASVARLARLLNNVYDTVLAAAAS